MTLALASFVGSSRANDVDDVGDTPAMMGFLIEMSGHLGLRNGDHDGEDGRRKEKNEAKCGLFAAWLTWR